MPFIVSFLLQFLMKSDIFSLFHCFSQRSLVSVLKLIILICGRIRFNQLVFSKIKAFLSHFPFGAPLKKQKTKSKIKMERWQEKSETLCFTPCKGKKGGNLKK